jgi:predicted membrane protein
MKITAKQIALVAVFAALYYVLSLIAPINIPTGIGALSVGFAAMIATIFGIILGPYLGFASALIGSLITYALTGMSPFSLPFILSPPLNALVSGALFYKKWPIAAAALGVFIVAFMFTPPIASFDNIQAYIWVVWDKIIALALIVPVAIATKFLSSHKNGARNSMLFVAIMFLIAFIGNQADNMWGSFAFALPGVYDGIFGMPLDAVRLSFLASPFLYPAIRIIQAVIATIIAVPLISALNGTNWLWQIENILTPKKIKQTEPEAPTIKQA